ncbi:hypothetical protein FOPE_09165 [Fonsecaea pedrosoi]|nr:hypothetical protein FOPE_09165 [Fonsecaea pedrosoi]
MSAINSARTDAIMSCMRRVSRYLDQCYDFDHLHAQIPSAEYHKYKQSQLNHVLDILLTLFDSNSGGAVPPTDPPHERPELGWDLPPQFNGARFLTGASIHRIQPTSTSDMRD